MCVLRGKAFKRDDAHKEGDSGEIRKVEALVLEFGQAPCDVTHRRGAPICFDAIEKARNAKVPNVVPVGRCVVEDAAPLYCFIGWRKGPNRNQLTK